jgi:pyruvate/2-oxoglutarate dehydrogenase complex dihydrolipoamide acyltransferase (E2) component
MTAIPPDQLRQLVREVLADVIGKRATHGDPTNVPVGGATAPPKSTLGGQQAGQWTVRISTDEDLHAFALRVLKIAGNPKLRQDLIAGRARFRLAGASLAAPAASATPASSAAPAAPASPAAPAAAHRVEKGAVTERTVAAAAAAGARLVLGPRAVLTPLARDKARALGVPIERPRGGWSDARAPGSTERPRGGWSDARAPGNTEREA